MKFIKCLKCGSSSVDEILLQKKVFYRCYLCDKIYKHANCSDSRLKINVTDENEEYHHAVGLFVRRPDGKFLLTRNNLPPFAWNLFFGHIQNDETDKETAIRRSLEFIGYEPKDPKLILSDLFEVTWCSHTPLHKIYVYEINLPKDFTPFNVFPGPSSGEMHWIKWDDLKIKKYRPLGPSTKEILARLRKQYE